MLTLLKKLYNKLFPKIVSALKEPIVGKYEDVITITWSDNTVSKYQGSGTVWPSLPMMDRCGVFREGKLSKISKYINKYGNPYPISHLKNK